MRALEQYRIAIEGRGLDGARKTHYEATISGMLQGIARAAVGKALLNSIQTKRTHRDWIIIVPYLKSQHAEYGRCNALAWDDRIPVQLGRTEVMAAKLNISPLDFAKSPCNAGPVMSPMDVLVHELVHCDRSLARIQSNTKLNGALAGYENEEEYFAVVFANVYASVHSLGNVADNGLRSDHDKGVLPSAEMDSAVFLANRDNYRLIAKYCQQQPKLTQEVAQAPGKFNPFRTYYEWKAKNIRVN